MNSCPDISSEYFDSTDKGTCAPSQRSQLREFLKAPVEEVELKKYGTSRPQRKIIRAKLIYDKN